MTPAISSAGSSIIDALLLPPSDGRRAWRRWRASTDLDSLDGDGLALLPLLSGRLPDWGSENSETDPEKNTILGICKRGWAQNQLRYRELVDVWSFLQQAAVDPIAISGCAAWALLYAEEKAVRPILSIDIMVHRDCALLAMQELQSAGWILEPRMPRPEGRALDRFEGVWFRSPSDISLFLTWRLRKVSPEMAAISEPIPSRVTLDLLGSAVYILSTEELLLDALTRQPDRLVSWKCDAVVLLRNRTIDWMRFRALSRHFPLAAERALQLQKECLIPVPRSILLKLREPGHLRRRLSALRVDYRQVAWANNETHSLHGFATYVLRRLLRITRPAQE